MASAVAADGSLTLLPSVPGYAGYASTASAVTPDGQWIVGTLSSAGNTHGFRWQKGVGVDILPGATSPIATPNSAATGVSDDGYVISGYSATSGYTAAQYWLGTTIATPPPVSSVLSSRSVGVTATGNTIAGFVQFSPMTGQSGFTYTNGVLSTYKVGFSMFTSFSSISPNGRYQTGTAQVGGPFVRDRLTNTLQNPAGGFGTPTLTSVANTGAAVGYIESFNPTPLRFEAGATTTLPPLPGGNGIGRALGISTEGEAVVGSATNALGQTEAFLWTAAGGTQSLRALLVAQGASIPGGVNLTEATSVRVTDGVAHISGTANSGANQAFVASVRLAPSGNYNVGGTLVDLNGTYTAVKNSTVGATTDPNGVGALARVHEPGTGFRYTPFSNTLKPPTALQGVDLRNKSYWFDVDLGDPALWPNPSSLYNWFIGNAADGQPGASLVINAGNSNGNGSMSVANGNGLRISFYRKDGAFYAYIRNLWYAQDFAIPQAANATRYRVRVDVSDGPITVKFTQLNGTGTEGGLQPSTTHYLIGGSTDYVGLTSASFLVQMINKLDTGETVAKPTAASVSNFGTNAIPNALAATADRPYFSSIDNPYPVIYRLRAQNLSAPITGYDAAARLDQPAGNTLSYYLGQYENTWRFEVTPRPSFPPNGLGEFWHGQRTLYTANATQDDTLLESYAFAVDPAAAVGGPYILSPLTQTSAGQFSKFYNVLGNPFAATPIRSNAVVLDNVPPVLSNLSVQVGGTTPTSLVAGQTVTVTVDASDTGSGLRGTPVLHVGINGPNGQPTIAPIRLGSFDGSTGTFRGTFVVPATSGAMSMTFGVSVGDNAGNYAIPLTQGVPVTP
ncbi:MAG: hypothetical protein ACO1SV_10270 [Fimbriimonas sp.]